MPGTRVCNLPAWKSIGKGRSERSLPTRSLGEVRTVAWGALLPAGSTTLCAQALGHLVPSVLFHGPLRALPLPAFPVLPVQGASKVLTGGAHSSLHVMMGLQLQAAVAQQRFRCCDPLPRLPGVCARQAAGGTGRRWHPLPCWPGTKAGAGAGLESLERARALRQASPGKPGSKIASLLCSPTTET